jgi:molybdate/tungstate transport system ATP-binding protein
MIRAENIDIKFPDFHLKSCSLHVREKEFFSVIGPTGSGKSLILELLTGLLRPDSGRVLVNGEDVTRTPTESRGLGIVYQDFALFPHLTARQNILYGTRYHNLTDREIRENFTRLTDTMGLSRILDRKPATLSGGEKQRVALSRSLILNPAGLLLDEPLSALDPMFQQEIKELLKTLHHDLGLTIIMVSHNFGEVLYLADRVALIHQGEIIQTGTTEEVFERPATPFAARFVGMSNLFAGTFSGERVYLGEEKVAVSLQAQPCETASHVAIRPEEIIPLVPGTNGLANAMTGSVTDIACHGFFFDVAVMVGGVKFTARWNRNQIREFGVKAGGEIGIGFHAGSVHVL